MLELLPPTSPCPPHADPRLERTTTRIRDLVAGTHLQMALSIGRIVVEEIYDGDLKSWRRRGPKDPSLRRLAADPRLTISASALYRALGIFELKVRFADHPMWDMLTACHLRAVLGLPESEQCRLLDLATTSAWTSQTLEHAAAISRDNHKTSRGGRSRKSPVVRAIETAERALAGDQDVDVASPAVLVELPAEQCDDLLRRLSLIRERCASLATALEGQLSESHARSESKPGVSSYAPH